MRLPHTGCGSKSDRPRERCTKCAGIAPWEIVYLAHKSGFRSLRRFHGEGRCSPQVPESPESIFPQRSFPGSPEMLRPGPGPHPEKSRSLQRKGPTGPRVRSVQQSDRMYFPTLPLRARLRSLFLHTRCVLVPFARAEGLSRSHICAPTIQLVSRIFSSCPEPIPVP